MATDAELIDQAHACFNQGNALFDQGRLEEAAESFRSGQRINRILASAYNNQGISQAGQGQMDDAVKSFREALRINPSHSEARYNLGNALKDQGNSTEAEQCYRQVLRINPHHADVHNNLGNALKDQGRLLEATECFRQALRINPNLADALNNLGVALKDRGLLDEAIAHYRQSLRINSQHADVHYNLGNALDKQGDLSEAAACYRQALLMNPRHALTHNNLGVVLKNQGELEMALAQYRKALELKPDYFAAHSNLIYALHYCPGQDAAALLAECRRWNECYAKPLQKLIQPHANDKSPERRLRIGYVSPDLGAQPVGRFLVPLLENHDHRQFEIFCYSALNVPDPITEHIKSQTDGWRPIFGATDEQVTQLIRQDRIDILVDLVIHTANHRLLVFARKPAPVQVTYLAYCGTTGLDTVDYRLTDPWIDPPGQSERFYSEQSVRLPDTYWCYQQVIKTPAPAMPPVLRTGQITFGCLNNFCKATDPALETWSHLLRSVPHARLLLNAPPGSPRNRVCDFFVRRDVATDRVVFVDRIPITEYFKIYQQIDVALDPFPYGGGTTTCDALWMGVPVVCLAGQTAVGRGGVSILSNIGLTDLIAQNTEDYVKIAAGLAGDPQRLTELRSTLRQRMRNSPLMDAQRFARGVEDAYRKMWQTWCAV